MTPEQERIERDRIMINEAQEQGLFAKLTAYTRLSGPGWLQSAITLGGGSLAGSLYLGVLTGYGALWWQPLAMILGVIMLSAIGYVALSTGERPFDSINRHINPVLGWGWAIATLMANLVWCMPQYSLGTAAFQQNLMPGVFNNADIMDADSAKWAIAGILFVITGIVIWFYDSGGWGVRVFEWLLKLMVAVVVVSFFAVVAKMSFSENGLPWSEIFAGFVPNFAVLSEPSVDYADVLSQAGKYRDYWESQIVSSQQKVMITAAATAVGINMTFLLPYSMLRKGWDKDFRGLAIFDLSTGLFIPYLLATTCVVLAAGSQFHAKEAPGLVPELSAKDDVPTKGLLGRFNKTLDTRVENEIGKEAFAKLNHDQKAEKRKALPEADRRLAAMLVQRDSFDLANALKRLTGDETIAQTVFGIGVAGMAISTIIILMLINGFVLTEITGQPENKSLHRLGCYLASVSGALGARLLWTGGDAQFWLAVPTSMFGLMLLPIAYCTFFLMMNSKSLMGDNILKGRKRLKWNLLMGIAVVAATAGCLWSIKLSGQATAGFSALGIFAAIAMIVHLVRKKPAA